MYVKEFEEMARGPHTLTMYEDGREVVIHCSRPRTDCGICPFRIEALVSEECRRKLPDAS